MSLLPAWALHGDFQSPRLNFIGYGRAARQSGFTGFQGVALVGFGGASKSIWRFFSLSGTCVGSLVHD